MTNMSLSNTNANTSKLDSELLRTFLAVAESGSFSHGAARIFRSQSAVSLQIKQLENTLGHAVFLRHARGVKFTSIGDKLLPTAQKVIGLLDEAVGQLRSNPLQGAIRIGIPNEYGDSLLASVIAQFSRDHPQVELSVRCGFSTSFTGALARDEIDLAVNAVESLSKNMLLLRKEKTYWVTSKNHQVHQQNPVPVALFSRDCWWRDQALEALKKTDKPYRIAFTSESVTGISAAVLSGAAVAAVGENSLRDDFQILSKKEGFPSMPDSTLILQQREGLDNVVSQAMSRAIRDAFRKG
jgi:DNA-binding transcriptional LysR family regulator